MKQIVCGVLGHSIDRNRVWDDGLNPRATCTRCRTSLIEVSGTGWRAFDERAHGRPGRLPHPRQRLQDRARKMLRADPPAPSDT